MAPENRCGKASSAGREYEPGVVRILPAGVDRHAVRICPGPDYLEVDRLGVPPGGLYANRILGTSGKSAGPRGARICGSQRTPLRRGGLERFQIQTCGGKKRRWIRLL